MSIVVSTSAPRHFMVSRLATRLSITRAHAIGLLCVLWCHRQDFGSKSGAIELLPEEIAEIVGWDGDANALDGVLRELGVRDNNGDFPAGWWGWYTDDDTIQIAPASREDRAYGLWRKAVLERDHRRCVGCGSGANLHVHHIKHYATHPELRLAIDNGETLCIDCHHRKHGRSLR